MKTIEKKIAKNGNTVYYMVDENGKKRQVSRKTAQEFIASNTREENKMENTVAFMTATAEEAAELIELSESADIAETNSTEIDSADIAETDGSEEDTDDYTAELNETFNLLPAISELNDVDDTEPATVANTEPAKIDNTAATKAKKTRKKLTAAEQREKWLADAKTDENGKYYIVPELTYKGMELNKGWNPCFYIVTNSQKLVRIGLKFAIELAKSDKAIEITKGGVKELKKAA